MEVHGHLYPFVVRSFSVCSSVTQFLVFILYYCSENRSWVSEYIHFRSMSILSWCTM